jgi:GT2 family glycosyltransferase
MERVSAVIPTWNKAALLSSALASLRAQTRPLDEIIVIDNGSTDATSEVARQSQATRIGFSQNLGFAKAVNEGILSARGDWILILNNDVELRPEWLATLLASASQCHASFAVGKLMQKDAPGILDGSWDLISKACYAWRCGWGREDGPIWSTRRAISFAPMTAALFKRSVFDAIGLLETRFESYYEDVDFGIRCALNGLTGIYEPAAVALHLGKATLGGNAAHVMYLSARNQLLLIAKHYPAETLRRFAWPIFAGQLLALAMTAKHWHLLAGLRGKWEALRQWRLYRREVHPRSRLEAVIVESEREILRLQQELGFDTYWRLYFSLMGFN